MGDFDNLDKDAEPIEEYSLVPAGWYQTKIADAYVEEKDDNSKILIIKFKIMKGEQTGRQVVIFPWLKKSQKSEDLTARILAAIREACDRTVDTMSDAVNMIDLEMDIKVGIQIGGNKPDEGKYNDKNSIFEFKKLGSQTGGETAQATPSGGDDTPEWKK